MRVFFILIATLLFNTLSFGNIVDSTNNLLPKKETTVFFSKKDCEKFGIEPLTLQNNTDFLPRYDGQNYFIDIEGMRNPNIVNEIPKLRIQEVIAKATNVITINDVNSLVNGVALNAINLQSLPLVIKVEPTDASKIKYSAVLLSLTFKSNETIADFAIVTDKSPLKNADNGEKEILYLGATDIKIKRGGKIQGNLTLISPKRINLFELDGYGELNLTLGTGVCMNCEGSNQGFKFNLAGSFIFDPNFARAELPDGTIDAEHPSPELFFSLELENWEPIIAFKLPQTYGLQFNDFSKLSFWSFNTTGNLERNSFGVCTTPAMLQGNLYLDLSDDKNPPITGLPTNFNKGFAFAGIKVVLPKEIENTDETGDVVTDRQAVEINYFAIGDKGVMAKGSKDLFQKLKLGKGYDITLTKFGLEIDNHKIKQFFLKGDLRLPIFEKDEYALNFLIGLKKTTNINSLNDIYFGAGLKSTEKKIPINFFGTGVKADICQIFVGTTTFDESEGMLGMGTQIDNWDFNKLSLTIKKGSLSLGTESDGKVKKVFRPFQFSFDKIVVSNKFPFVEAIDGLVSGANTDLCNATMKVDKPNEILGFGFSISDINYNRPQSEDSETNKKFSIGANVGLELGFSQKEAETDKAQNKQKGKISFEVGGIFSIKGHVDQLSEGKKYKYAFDDISINGVNAAADLPAFYLSASLELFDEGQKKFGVITKGGFDGKAEFGVKMAGAGNVGTNAATGGGARALFLKPLEDGKESAWAVDAYMNFGEKGIPSGGMYAIKKLSGGAYKNFSVFGGNGDSPFTNTLYKYDLGKWGFKIGADMTLNSVDLNAMFMAQGTTGRGLDWIKAMAYAQFPVDYSDLVPSVVSNLATKVSNISNKIEGISNTVLSKNGASSKNDEAKKDPRFNDNQYRAVEAVCNAALTMIGVPPAGKNRIGAGAVITLAMNKSGDASGSDDPTKDTEQSADGYFSIYLKPDIQVKFSTAANTSVTSTGYGLLYLSSTAKYLYLGKPKDRLGVIFDMSAGNGGVGVSASAYVNAYFMLGNQIETKMPNPLVPERFAAEFNSKVNNIKDDSDNGISETYGGELKKIQEGTGIAMGAAVGVKFNMRAAYVFDVDAGVGVGFDALVVSDNCPGWDHHQGGNWHGSAQIYGFGYANIKAFGLNLVDFGLGFLLKASIPQPIYAEGRFFLYLQIWRSKVNLNVRGQIGNEKPSNTCVPDAVTPTIKEVYAEMIKDFSPSQNQLFPRTGLMKLNCELSTDQYKQSGAEANFKQEITYKIFDSNNQLVSADNKDGWAVEDGINTKDLFEGKNLVRFAPKLAVGKTFGKGGTYKIQISTRIYTEEPYTDENGDPVGLKETVYQLEDGVKYYLKHKDKETGKFEKEFAFKIAENDFLLDPSEVLLYPAQDQYNVYQNDYNGNGYFKVHKLVAQKLNEAKSTVTSANFYLRVYDANNSRVINQQLNNNWETDFDIKPLATDKNYEIRIVGNIEGEEKDLLKKHFFRIDSYERFDEKIQAISQTHKYNYRSTHLAIDINYDGNTPPDLLFSNEEKEKLLSFEIEDDKQWFEDFRETWNNNFERPYRFILTKEMVKLNQAVFPYFENGTKQTISTGITDTKPSFTYAPFEKAVWDFFGQENSSGVDSEIPLVQVDDELCIIVKHDVRNLEYFKERSFEGLTSAAGLPSRIENITSDLCFKNEEELDFNDINKVKKTVEITCKRSKLDSEPTELTFELKRDGKEIDFQTPFELDFYYTIKNTSECAAISTNEAYKKITITGNDAASKLFIATERKSKYECPIACSFVVKSKPTQFNVVVNALPREKIKPCVTFKDVTQATLSTKCCDELISACNGDAECEKNINCGQLCAYVSSSDRYVQVESWEGEEANAPQLIEGNALEVVFNNGSIATITPSNQASSIIQISEEDYKNLTIVVDGSKEYTCGTNKDKINYLSSLKPYNAIGNGTTETEACASTTAKTIYALVEETKLVVSSANGTSFFSNNTVMPAPNANGGFYTFSRAGGQKEYYQLSSTGQLIGTGYCAKGKPVLCLILTDLEGHDLTYQPIPKDQDLILKYNFYTDNTRTKAYIPKNIPSGGLSILLTNGAKFVLSNNISSGQFNYPQSYGSLNVAQVLPSDLFELCLPPVRDCNNKPAPPILAASKTLVNYGENISLTVSGCNGGSYLWFNGEKGEEITDIVYKESSYSVKCLKDGCVSDGATQTVKLKPLKIVSTDSKTYACSGKAKTLEFQGCSAAISWTSADVEITNPTEAIITVNPTKAASIKATCTSTIGTSQSATYTLDYFESPTSPTITFDAVQVGVIDGTKVTVCQGESIKINATSCSTAGSYLLWSNNASSVSTIIVNPTTTTIYSVECTNNKCSSAKSNELTASVTVMKKAEISAPILVSTNKQLYQNRICIGGEFQLSEKTCETSNTIDWYENGVKLANTGKSVQITKASKGDFIYTARCVQDISNASKSKKCEGVISSSIAVKVIDPNTDMTIAIVPPSNDGKVCSYSELTLVGSGCTFGQIEWKKGTNGTWTTQNNKTAKGADGSDTYFTRCNLNDVCTKEISTYIEVIQEPSAPTALNSSGNNNQICENSALTLTGSCINSSSIKWESLSANQVTPVYTAAGWNQEFSYKAYCSITSGTLTCETQSGKRPTLTVKVYKNPPVPNITASFGEKNDNYAEICQYQSSNISVANYSGDLLWKVSNGQEQGPISGFNDINTSNTYTARSRNWECYSSYATNYTLHVNNRPLPPTLSSNKSGFTCNESVILSASGCSGIVHWSNGSTGVSVSISGVQNTNYTAYCTDDKGCDSNNSDPINVEIREIPAVPSISGNTSYCVGDEINLSASTSTSDASINWKNYNTTNKPKPAVGSHTYTVSASKNGCSSDDANINITVHAYPAVPTLSSNKSEYTCNESVTLTAAGCSGVVHWSNGSIGASITISGIQNTDFTAYCAENGCNSGNSSPINVSIRDVPASPNISGNTSYCVGDEINLSASTSTSDASINWENYNPANKPKPSAGAYTYTVHSTKNGCKSENVNINVAVNAYPSAPTVTPTYNCGGTNLTINNCTGNAYFEWGSADARRRESNGFGAIPISYDTYCEKNGCTTQGSSYTPNVTYYPSAPTLSPNKTTLCNGESTSIVVTAGNGTFSYIKKVGESETSGVDFNSINVAGSYFVRTSNTANGITCSVESNKVTISTVTASNPTVTVDTSPACYNVLTYRGCEGSVNWWYGGINNENDASRSGTWNNVQVHGATNYFRCSVGDCKSGITTVENPMKGNDVTPDWQDTGVTSCDNFNTSSNVRTCTKQQKDMNPCSPTGNTTKDVVTHTCSEIINVTYNSTTDSFSSFVGNDGCSGVVQWYYTGNGLTDENIGSGSSVNAWKGLGRYEARCTNPCGTTSSGTAYKQ